MILINIVFLDEGEKHGDSIAFQWPAAPSIGDAINLYAGPYKGEYRVVGVLWEPTIDWTGNVQSMSPNGCSATIAVRRVNAPKPPPTEDTAKALVELNEMASRQRQELFNTRADLRNALAQVKAADEQRDEMRKDRDASRASVRRAETKLQDASLKIAELERIIEELKELK